VRSVAKLGSHLNLGAEQGGKCVLIGATAIANRVAGVNAPCILIVKSNVQDVKELETKIAPMLAKHHIYTRYVAGKVGMRQIITDPQQLDAVRCGRTVLVVPAHPYALCCLAMLLELTNLDNVCLIADESDAIWTNKLTAEETAGMRWSDLQAHFRVTLREVHMHRILGIAPLCREPGPRCSRVRSFVQVSATHIASLAWHRAWDLPFYGTSMKLDLLRERGYALYEDIKPMKARAGAASSPSPSASALRQRLRPPATYAPLF